MAVGIAGGIGELPNCASAVPAWVRSCWGFLLGGRRGERGSESLCWVCARPGGGFFPRWDPLRPPELLFLIEIVCGAGLEEFCGGECAVLAAGVEYSREAGTQTT